MTSRPVIYDMTRLLTRLGRPVPNGIDRVDIAYAKHFLGKPYNASAALIGPRGSARLICNDTASAVARLVEEGWRETALAGSDPDLWRVLNHLKPGLATQAPVAMAGNKPSLVSQLRRLLANTTVMGAKGLWPGRNLVLHAPEQAIYLNVSQFPIWRPRYLHFLAERKDIAGYFFIHDALPIQYPEFFRPFEVRRHHGRLAAVASHAKGVIVPSQSTRAALERHFKSQERAIPEIIVAPLVAPPTFARRADDDVLVPMLPFGRRYFVVVGTLEPRKNHLFLLHIWKQLAQKYGSATPVLVVVGARGWECENVIDMLERSPTQKQHVVHVSRLSTPALRLLLAHADALLMPTFAEGFGLPVAEALAAGIPVIVSDIDVFEEFPGHGLRRVDPIDGPGWLREIEAQLNLAPAPQAVHQDSGGGNNGGDDTTQTTTDVAHFRHLDAYLQCLPEKRSS